MTSMARLALALGLCIALRAGAADPAKVPATGLEDLDDVLQGFDASPSPAEPEEPPGGSSSVPEGALELDGYVKWTAGYNLDHEARRRGEIDRRGLSKLRQEVRLDAGLGLPGDWRAQLGAIGFYDLVYRVEGRERFPGPLLDAQESGLDLREAYLRGGLAPDLDLSVGRQVLVWGKADVLRVTDVLNPLDLREPGVVDIEDLRLPVTMTRLALYRGPFTLGVVAVHELRRSEEPALGSEYYPFPVPLPGGRRPAVGVVPEYGIELSGRFTGWDLSLYWARVYADTASFRPTGSLGSLAGRGWPIERGYDRLEMLGAAGNLALGSWLLKAELARFDGLMPVALGGESASRADLLVGLDYMGYPGTVITLESVVRHMLDQGRGLDNPLDNIEANRVQTVLRYQRDLLRDRLRVTGVLSLFGPRGEEGGFLRATAQYAVSDRWSLLGGAVVYYAGDEPLSDRLADNDRLFLEAKMSF